MVIDKKRSLKEKKKEYMKQKRSKESIKATDGRKKQNKKSKQLTKSNDLNKTLTKYELCDHSESPINTKRIKLDSDNTVKQFKEAILRCALIVCVCCKRLFYKEGIY
jgi:hypothetical protein